MSQNDSFSPDAPEGAAPKAQHFSFKDLRVIGVALVLLGAALWPAYQYGKRKSERVQCINNFKAMSDAIGLYAKDHDDGLPPVFRTDERGMPALGENGLPYTWASDIAPYLSPRASFLCPSADESEIAYVEDPRDSKARIAVTYGMYYPYGAFKTFNIESPDATIIITETSNLGAASSFDPLPFTGPDGNKIADAFSIGWNDDNFVPKKNGSRMLTRLALRNTADGDLSDAYARHDEGNNALSASGALITLTLKEAVVPLRDGYPSGLWSVPARSLLEQ